MNNPIFNIILPNEKAATYKVVTFIVSLVNTSVFAWVYFNSTASKTGNIILIALLLNVFSVGMLLYEHFTKKRTAFWVELVFIISAICWLIAGKWLVAVLLLIFAWLGFYTNRPVVVQVTEAGVRYPVFPPQHFQWQEISGIMLKDDVLTIDLKNNRFIQITVSANENAGLSETAFNSFCATQLVEEQV